MKSFSPIAKPLEFSHIETKLLLNLRDETFFEGETHTTTMDDDDDDKNELQVMKVHFNFNEPSKKTLKRRI